jgi:RalA-binding protein 1
MGHAPATLDARRAAINAYFDDLLDTHVDEQSAVMICKFLSTDVIEPTIDVKQRSGQPTRTQSVADGSGKLKKTGYLTKKGKNFGGWKSRYFVLDSPELRYFEAPGGAHLGTVKLQSAKIGRQTTTDESHEDGDAEGQFRHAFLILEPKRKDSNSYVRHVLCAENDSERDEWVRTLLYYVEEGEAQESRPATSAANASELSGLTGNPRSLLRGTDFADGLADSSGKSSSPTLGPRHSGSNSPTSPSPATPDAVSHDPYWPKQAQNPHSSASQRGTGSKGQPFPQPHKEQKIRNLFAFRKSSHEQLSTSQSSDERAKHDQRKRAYVRPVFGLALAEAVEVCPPHDVDVLLPAVVYRCIEYLRENEAASEEGLFRLSGSNLVVRNLKERFNTEGDVDLVGEEEYYDVHAVASLFKTYLRELPSTILTRDLHIDFLNVLDMEHKQQKVIAFNSLVHQLPPVNFALLRALSEYLLEVVQNSDKNKMSVKNVGIVFSPTLNIPAPVIATFLTNFDAIFNQDVRDLAAEEVTAAPTMLAPPGGPVQSEIRSPRLQNFANLPSTPAPTHTSYNHNALGQPYSEQQYQPDPAGDVGMAPIHGPVHLPANASYEGRHYVSIPAQQQPPPQPLYPPPQPQQPHHQHQTNNHQAHQRQQYRMFAPEHAANEKAKRRESAMLLF